MKIAKKTIGKGLFALGASAAMIAGLAMAGDGHAHDHEEGDHHGEQVDWESMSPEQMMEMIAEASAPGEHHASMKKAEGEWKTVGKFWMDPAGEPIVSDGWALNKVVLGGRFMETVYKDDDFLGQPFEGHGLEAYDKANGKHISLWWDSLSTAPMTLTGTCDETGAIEMKGKQPSPDGSLQSVRSVMTWISDDEYKYESFMVMPDGNEFKHMEIVYTRM